MLITNRPVLMLDKGFQAYDAKVLSEAFGDVCEGRAQFIDEMYNMYDLMGWLNLPILDGEDYIRTPSRRIKIPEVMRFKSFKKKQHRRIIYCRKNLWKRDLGVCQYCGTKPRPDEVTIDHVVPKAQGGVSCFENCVLACLKCNLKKSGRTPEQAGMQLKKFYIREDGSTGIIPYDRPEKPTWNPLYNLPRLTRFPNSWKNFLKLKNEELYWQVELEP